MWPFRSTPDDNDGASTNTNAYNSYPDAIDISTGTRTGGCSHRFCQGRQCICVAAINGDASDFYRHLAAAVFSNSSGP